MYSRIAIIKMRMPAAVAVAAAAAFAFSPLAIFLIEQKDDIDLEDFIVPKVQAAYVKRFPPVDLK